MAMTAVRSLHSVQPAQPPVQDPHASRLIGVGVHDAAHDRATIEWALNDAVARRDEVHLVHAYVPLRLDGCAWMPVSTVRDRRHSTASRVIAQAVQKATESHGDLVIGGSAIGGLPDDVLIELSSVVDLLVIGDDSVDGRVQRKVTSRVQDAARCPLVCVPHDYFPIADDRPVTVVVDESGLAEPVLAFAAAHARRRGATLQVSRAWSSLHEGRIVGPQWLAEQQEELDAQLSSWRAVYPDVPVIARLELGYTWLDRLRAASSALIAGTRSVDLVRPVGEPLHSCPVIVVPDGM
jgi:hypothetical protein